MYFKNHLNYILYLLKLYKPNFQNYNTEKISFTSFES